MTGRCDVRAIDSSTRVWYASDKAALLSAVPPPPDYVAGNIRTWHELDRPVCLLIGPDDETGDENDLYILDERQGAPLWWNQATTAWKARQR